MRTLLTNGYSVAGFQRPADGAFILDLTRVDMLGGISRTTVLFTARSSAALITRLRQHAGAIGAAPLVVRLNGAIEIPDDIRSIGLTRFYELLGGEVRTDRIFRDGLPALMDKLGRNQLPRGFAGKPDQLLETYCQDCWSYLLNSPVRRFGQERSGERLGDGLVLSPRRYNLYFDAKAYSGGYHPDSADMRAYEEYVRDFNERYQTYLGPIACFAVISGRFSKAERTLNERAQEFRGRINTQMIFITAKQLAVAVDAVRSIGYRRRAIAWNLILAGAVFDERKLEKEIRRVERDGVV